MQAGACPDASDAVWWVELIVNAVEGDEEAVTALRELTQSSVGFSMNFSCTCWAGNVLTALIVASELQPQARSRVSKRVVESALFQTDASNRGESAARSGKSPPTTLPPSHTAGPLRVYAGVGRFAASGAS